MEVFLESVTKDSMDTYITVGTTSYRQHYLHLWPNDDPTPYISTSFTLDIVSEELDHFNMENYLVKSGDTTIGIVKLVTSKGLDEHLAETTLFIEKVYLLQEFSGKGLGTQLLGLIEAKAKKMGKTLIWLDTMQKGPQLNFYLKNGFQIKRASKLRLQGAKEQERPMWILTKQI